MKQPKEIDYNIRTFSPANLTFRTVIVGVSGAKCLHVRGAGSMVRPKTGQQLLVPCCMEWAPHVVRVAIDAHEELLPVA